MSPTRNSAITRRRFVSTTAVGTVAAFAAPAVMTASKTDSVTVVGEGDYQYEVIHAWPQLPDKYTWQTTHNVAVDKSGNVYVIHEGRKEQKDHPSIFVFDPEGRFVRAFGSQFQGGGHGIEIRTEGSEEFVYACGYQNIKAISKLTLTGDVVWHKRAPMESGVYAAGEDRSNRPEWGQDRFLPTNFTFLPDGDFLLIDGYGSYYIHRYDKDGNWKSCFGGPESSTGAGRGKFNLPHGIWVDNRKGREPSLVICDRANHAVQYLTLDGRYIETLTGYGLPANADTYEDLLVIPELHARVTLHGKDNEVVARLGDDVHRITNQNKQGIRGNPHLWKQGKFIHPHDACFDNEGNILVAEWVVSGRITKLKRLG